MRQPAKPSSPLRDAVRIFFHNKPAIAASIMLVLLATAAISGKMYAGKKADIDEQIRMEEADLRGDTYKTEAVSGAILDPVSTELKDTFLPPWSTSNNEKKKDKRYYLGTDHLGRDVLARLWAGSTISLTIGFLAVGISVLLGVALGGIAGYFGRGRVGLMVMATMLLLLSWGILLAAGIPVAGWICFGIGAGLMLGQLAIATIGLRVRTVGFFVASLALFGGLTLYNHNIETTTPEGAVYTEASQTYRQAYDVLLELKAYGETVKAWEEQGAENLRNLNAGKDIPDWMYQGQLQVERNTRNLILAVERLNGVKYVSGNKEALRLAIEQQDRSEHLKLFVDDYAARFEKAAAAEKEANAERDRLFAAGEQDAARDMAEEAAAHGKRKNTFDPEQLKVRIEQLKAVGEANEAYLRALIAATEEPLTARDKAIADAEAAIDAVLAGGAADAGSLRKRQFELEEVVRRWDVADAEFKLADARLRKESVEQALKARQAQIQDGSDPGVEELARTLAVQTNAVTTAESGLSSAKERITELKEARNEMSAEVAKKLLPPIKVQGSSDLVDRRGKLRKAFVINYETEMRNALTALRVAEQLNGSYRYRFYRITSHFLTTTALYLLLIVATLIVMAAAQDVVFDRIGVLKPLYLPTISVDDLVMRFTEIMLTIPVIFLILMILAIFEKDVYITMGVIGLTSWMGTTRFVRAEILSLREQDFVQSAKALGMPDFRIIWRHLVPNAISPVLVSATLGVAGAVLAESTLSFLGIGAKADQTTWGLILSEGREYIFDASWLTWIPGLAILITVLSFNLLGEGLREAFNPKLRGR